MSIAKLIAFNNCLISTAQSRRFTATADKKIGWQTDKPGSVMDEHSSRRIVTNTLKQPTRVQRGQRHTDTYLVLLRVEFTLP